MPGLKPDSAQKCFNYIRPYETCTSGNKREKGYHTPANGECVFPFMPNLSLEPSQFVATAIQKKTTQIVPKKWQKVRE